MAAYNGRDFCLAVKLNLLRLASHVAHGAHLPDIALQFEQGQKAGDLRRRQRRLAHDVVYVARFLCKVFKNAGFFRVRGHKTLGVLAADEVLEVELGKDVLC